MQEPPPTAGGPIPTSLGARDYATAWDNVARVRTSAFQLVDESRNEDELARSGEVLAPFLIRGLSMQRSDVVLEMGCGVARLGKEVAPHVHEYRGLDVSAEMIAIAKDRCRELSNVRFFVGNGRDMRALPDASVDKAFCHAVFIHMDKEDVYSYLVEARRVLKPGGLFYFDVWNVCHEVGWLRWQCERALYPTRAQRPIHRNQFSSPGEVRAMLRKARLEPLQVAESFYVHTVATRVPDGADSDAFLADLADETGRCYEILRYTEGDARSFAQANAARLREHGIEPEIDMTPYGG